MTAPARPLTLPIRVRDLLPGDVFLDPKDPSLTDPIRYEVNTLPTPDPLVPNERWYFRATGISSQTRRPHSYSPDRTLEVIQ